MSIMHRRRKTLGGRSSLEVLTGRRPDNDIRLTMWSGTRLKDAKRGDVDMKVVDKYCERIEKSLISMHE